jgi:methylenetetrahydrofolate dehydrogenase (NADP+)/methenyltetrahydrofolate cyclohydrolase
MSALLLSGREVAAALLEELRAQVADLPAAPRLVFVRAGDDPASASYVRSKARLAGKAGVRHETRVLPPEVDQAALLTEVARLNADADVDGILVQLPLYDHLDPAPVLEAIDPAKDVDGFHPVNVGRLWSGQPGLVPATPSGLIRILDHYDIPIEGRDVLIVGRSNLVGKPATALFLRRHATVTVAHSRTRDLPGRTRRADVIVAAAGRPGMIRPDMVRAGAVLLDVGQAPVDGKLRGDVAPEVAEVAGAMTPTPGGTGPMTVAMVVANTVAAARARRRSGG